MNQRIQLPLTEDVMNSFLPCKMCFNYDKLIKDGNVIHTHFISTDAVAFSNAHFGAGIGTVHLHVVGCTGRETNLTDCPQFYSNSYCFQNHSADAGVRCQGWHSIVYSVHAVIVQGAYYWELIVIEILHINNFFK